MQQSRLDENVVSEYFSNVDLYLALEGNNPKHANLNLYKYFFYPFNVTTPDQLILSMMNHGRYTLKSIMMRKSLVVLDEIHAYDAYSRTHWDKIVEFERKIRSVAAVHADERYALYLALRMYSINVPVSRSVKITHRSLDGFFHDYFNAIYRRFNVLNVPWFRTCCLKRVRIKNILAPLPRRMMDLSFKVIYLYSCKMLLI